MTQKRPYRQRKGDRLVNPGANKEDIACDHALAPFDRLSREMEFKWGIDKLPELVSPATAEKFGITIGNLNAALEANIPADVVACAESGIRGLQYMDAEATAAGHKPHDADWWEYELPGEDGGEPFRIAVLRDGLDWQEVKANRPDLVPYSLREVAVELNVGQLMLLLQFGNMRRDLTFHNTELFANKVAPQLRGLFEDEWENRWWPRPLASEQIARAREIRR